MDKIKIAFFDIDGTLIDSKKKKITERKISRIDESLYGKFYCKMKNKNEKHFQIPLTYKNNVIK